MKKNISVGLLAHNESKNITTTLQSLFQQSLFTKSSVNIDLIEVIIVPNGCTDNTADLSRTTLGHLVKQVTYPNVVWRVCEVEQPGKSNAWNLYIHQFSAPSADYLILMDADIQFLELDTLLPMINLLENTPEAWIAVDKPVKDIVIKNEKKSFIDLLSIAASTSAAAMTSNYVAIAGSLYCGQSSKLREIWMPVGLPVEDGFLRAMITTDRFTCPEIPMRVQRSLKGAHMYEANISILRLINHEKRLRIGIAINSILFSYLGANSNKDQDAGSLIHRNNVEDPRWLRILIQQAIKEKGWWLIPSSSLFRRFRNLRCHSLYRALLGFPFAVIAFPIDFLACFLANKEIRRGGGLGYW